MSKYYVMWPNTKIFFLGGRGRRVNIFLIKLGLILIIVSKIYVANVPNCLISKSVVLFLFIKVALPLSYSFA